jgi:hypothetical protein
MARSGVETIGLKSVCVNADASTVHLAVIGPVRASAATVARAMVSDAVRRVPMVQVTDLALHKPARPRPR